ncbi:MAG: aminomethyl-transferring glycine dehydrogenase, partial [Chloroflexi bacterium]|nr:aminomethyl-transferring glycine dehydrogenase [Chloroflexota bacterium]
MPETKKFGHPFIPNSAPAARERALREIGIKSVEDIYAVIPPELRFKGKLDLPKPFTSEVALKRHVTGIIEKNKSTHDYLSFLGAGIWQHHVPAVCNEIANRGEFLTAYGGGPFGDHGKFQALFESQSMMGELLEMEAVAAPTYDWSAAAGSAILMACRITGRNETLVPENLSDERSAQIWNFVRPHTSVVKVKMDPSTGRMDLKDLKSKVSDKTASVYFENPTYLGTIETEADVIVQTAHAKGALAIAGVDPITLGVLTPPGSYGADIAVGDYQTLGMPMYGGGGLGGFISSRDDPKFVGEMSTYLISIGKGPNEGEHVFGVSAFDRTHYETRATASD